MAHISIVISIMKKVYLIGTVRIKIYLSLKNPKMRRKREPEQKKKSSIATGHNFSTE